MAQLQEEERVRREKEFNEWQVVVGICRVLSQSRSQGRRGRQERKRKGRDWPLRRDLSVSLRETSCAICKI